MSIVGLTAMGWIGAIVFIVFLLLFLARKREDKRVGGICAAFLVLFVIGIIALIGSILLYFNNTAVGNQQLKSWSAQSSGIYREIEVYSMTGEKISEYSGVFNIEYSDTSVNMFNVETQERVIVYYQNGTIIVTEPHTSE